MKHIKLCNIKNVFETRMAGRLGIPFLGYHLISENDRKRISEIKACVRELRIYFPKTISVLVTKEKDAQRIIKQIEEIEFDGVQLHYQDSAEQIKILTTMYGSSLKIFKVISSEAKIIDVENKRCDFLILDKSFLGGTGKPIDLTNLSNILSQLDIRKTFIAGGISSSNVHQYIDMDIAGFDVQSSIKSTNPSKYENTDYSRVSSLASLLGYTEKGAGGQVGFVVHDIAQNNTDLLMHAISQKVDFLHIDISDGFVGNPSNLNKVKRLIQAIRSISTHVSIQVHLFSSSADQMENVLEQTNIKTIVNLKVFLHINRNNHGFFNNQFVSQWSNNFAVDVKDVTDETFPWENFISPEMIICLQSPDHPDRIDSLDRALKMIRYSSKFQVIATLDRNVDLETVTGLNSLSGINIVCGSYLKENLSTRYELLKSVLKYGKN